MRLGVLLLIGACGFETQVPPPGDFNTPDGARPPDAAIDAKPPDAPLVKVCAAAYVAVPATQTLSKYRRNQAQTPWLTAKADCESDGGYLAIPETMAEAIAIHAFIDPLETSPYFWAGISDSNRDGQWTTVTGVPFTAIVWGVNEPDQRVGEIYALVYGDGTYYDWFDYGEQEYACECAP